MRFSIALCLGESIAILADFCFSVALDRLGEEATTMADFFFIVHSLFGEPIATKNVLF